MVPDPRPLDVSVVLPCLDEAETLATCVRSALDAIVAGGFRGEVIVADNGSTDGSQAIAVASGARLVEVEERGYGSALRAGIEAARGEMVIMADADQSYDFGAIGAFVSRLRDGHDMVIGNRFSGGIDAGAMPWLHRFIGNPVLSGLGRILFDSPVRDFHCGIRGIRRDAYPRLGLSTTGMEFASEMVIKATLLGLRITEIPAVLHRDGRSRPPHLRSWRDGWRHLRFMLLFSPRWLFLLPGLLLLAAGGLSMAALAPGPLHVGGIELDIHTMLVAGFAAIVGHQVVVFAAFTKIFAIREGFHLQSPALNRMFAYVRLETGLLLGAALILAGLGLLVWAAVGWQQVGLGNLNPRTTMRQAIPAVVLTALGIQTIFASFFLSILGIPSRDHTMPGRV
ncbi:MAG: glycosyltransferase [Candidatus Dormibacteria bacterium]